MGKKYFKAKIPFSNANGIYNPVDNEPNIEDAALVEAWEAAGYCEILGDVEEKQEEPEKEAPENAENGPNEADEVDEDTNAPDEGENDESGENEPENDTIDAMSYPQLKKAAKAAKIKNYNTMKKEDLIKALKEA